MATGLVNTNDEKAAASAESQWLQFLLNAYPYDDTNWEKNVEETLEPTLSQRPIKSKNDDEIFGIINSLKTKRVPCDSNVTNKQLKELPKPYLHTVYHEIVIAVYKTPIIPKKANVILFPNPDNDSVFLQNHRSVGLLSSLPKIVKRVILC